MFTELAAAGDLYTYLESHKNKLEDVHARLITRQIALALKYLHSNGIAHRDIKLENVLLSNTDIGARVILTDFGLANYVDQRTGRMFSTVGTEGYAAP
jgi:serine/threonine protein kinase